MDENMQAQTTFDRVYAGLEGLPQGQSTKPSTVTQSLPLVGLSATYVVQTFKDKDRGFTIFLQVVDAEGRARFVIPNKVALAIYRQRQSLADRSTPESRRRKTQTKAIQRKKQEKLERKQRWAERHQ